MTGVNGALDQLQAQHGALVALSVDVATADLEDQLDAALARIAELEAQLPDPDPDPEPTGRFFGDPGVGKVLTGGNTYGGSANVGDARAWLDQQTGVKHVLARRYYTDQGFWNQSRIQADHDAGLVPNVTMKLLDWSFAQILAGAADSAIRAAARWAKGVGFLIKATFYHEPEDNFTTASVAADYRAVARRVIGIFREEGATNVIWGPCFMTPWTFQSASNRSWWWWDYDWKGTVQSDGKPAASDFYSGADRYVDYYGHDVYTPHINQSGYHEFAPDMEIALDDLALVGRDTIPWFVDEFGTRGATGMPSDGWAGYYKRAFRYMRDNGGVGFTVYNTDGNNFANGTDGAARLAGYKAALQSEAAYLVTVAPA